MADTLTGAMTQLERNIQQLESDTKWACGEIERLRAENLELKLKVQNLEYFISTITTRKPNEARG